ncbi:Regulator of rDNA transcription protein 5 [Candida viswanathii]|uniref:Large ribosomal subunit protein eL29 n=1 Tax=Candida viswanathii TaxID=5486 RepID=A0A367XTG8_9ASCO|nr:Regulator of rDNA transcription protein 5 [Candida viswanathii]
MAKSKNHTAHNQTKKAHKNGIKKPKTYKYPSLKGVDAKFKRNHRYALHGTAKALAKARAEKQQSISTMTENSSKRYRVYIKNLSYETSEGDLEELFKKHEPINVLIPSYTIHFSRSGRHRPLGIAYAEFKTQEQLDAVIREFDGYALQNRKITVKKHLPYNPGNRRFSLKSNKSELSKNGSSNKSIVSSDDNAADDATSSGNVPVLVSVAQPIVLPVNDSSSIGSDKKKSTSKSEISTDTILIPKAHGKVTDATLREFFKDYSPTQIYIFRTRKPKLNPINLTGSYVSVLATVDASQTKLDDIITNLKAQKLNGKYVNMKPAYMSKVAEVEKAATRLSSLEVIEGSSSSGNNVEVNVNEAETTAEEKNAEEESTVPVEQDSGNQEVAAIND